jgi:hypothetical protein
MRQAGIHMTIGAVGALGLGIVFLVKGMSIRTSDDSRGTTVEYIGGTLIASGVLAGAIGAPLWIVGQSRMNRRVMQPFVSRAQGGLLTGIRVAF